MRKSAISSPAQPAGCRDRRYLRPRSVCRLGNLFTIALALIFCAEIRSTLADNLLTGTIIGTSGSWNNSGNTKEKAMDGSLTTFFDAPTGNGDWVGLDLGTNVSKVISQVRYCPRSSNEARMVGGKFQGANAADFSGAVDLYTITAQPVTGTLTTQSISVTNAFRYVRYLSPDGGFGNVAEVQFYEAGVVLPPPTFGVYRELWTNLNSGGGATLDMLTNTAVNPNWPSNPATVYTKIYTNFETEAGTGMNNYGQRLRAFVVPPNNGVYTFWIASDDASKLSLSSNESPGNCVGVAWVNAWTDAREWTKEANQKSGAIYLEGGKRYYLEALMVQGGGGDNLSVRWQLPDGSIEEPLGGTRLIPYTGLSNTPGIYVQPTNLTVTEHGSAAFSVLTTNQSEMTYRWRVNGVNLNTAQASQSVYTVSNASVTLNGQSYSCVLSNSSGAITSAPAVLTIIGDTTPPTLVSAKNGSLTNIIIRYSEPVEPTSATNRLNYAISPSATVSSVLMFDSQSVLLLVSSLAPNTGYTVTVNGVRDLASTPNMIAANSKISFTASAYGLGLRPAFGPFLNNQMPETAPVISGNWSAVVAFTNLTFTNALGLASVPGTDKLVVWEREGRVYSFTNDPGASSKTLVLDLSNQCQGWDDSGLLNLVFHPGFVTNHFVFVYYTWVTPGTVVGSPTVRPPTFVTGAYHDRLSRFTLDANGVAIPGSELVLVDQAGDCVWHNGSGMFFHPTNGFLYVTDGDDENTSNTQIIDRGLFSGVWRLDVDMRGGAISHPIPRQPVNGVTANYYIPNDNPFVGVPNALEEFYAIGLRSPHRMTCDPVTGRIFIGDVGNASWEELDVIEPNDPPGLNFQWSVIEGLNGDLTPPYIGVNRRPILNYSHSEGQAIIGGYVYRGSQFAADLGGKYIFGDNVQKKIWALDESTTPAGKILLCTMPTGAGPNSGSDYTGLSSFGLDKNNELYLCQMSSVGGHIFKLARSGPPPVNRPIPATLSATGAFKDLSTLAVSDGLVPYTVNSPLWSDGAAKQRWIGLPTNSFVHFAPTGEWAFPNGTVLVKHFDLPVDDTNPNVLRRLETRLLVRDTNGVVYGVTYKWRTDYSDADIVTNGISENIVINTASGTRTQTWYYPGPLDCLRCHTAAAGYVLGVKTRQLNGNLSYPVSGVTDNQLRAWNHAEMFDTNIVEANISGYSKLVKVSDTSASLELRVRSYLDANCSQCHRPGGAPAFWDARFDIPLTNQNIINGVVGDTLGIAGAKVVVPQDLTKSVMYLRVNSLGTYQMPPLARNTIDSSAVTALAEWITTLPSPQISAIADVLMDANSSTGPIGFTVSDGAMSPDQLMVSASSSNPSLIPSNHIVIQGSGNNRTITVTPAANQTGSAIISIVVNDGTVATTGSFTVTVRGMLAAYYKFEGNAQDSSGQGNDGVLNGGVTFVPGKVGAQAVQLDGSTGYVQIPVSAIDDFTISLWLKTTDTGGTGQWWAGKGLVDGEVSGGSADFGTTLVGNQFALGVGGSNGNPDVTILSSTAVNDGVWHHLLATRNSTTGQMAVYVDGGLESTGTGSVGPRVGPPALRIGGIQTGTATGFLAGTVDDVRIYNYVLSSSQISSLATRAPVLAPIPNFSMVAGATLRLTNSAVDAAIPPETFAFSLLSSPAGANLNGTNGVLTWRPTMAQANTSNQFAIKVSDSGSPSTGATQSFWVSVVQPVRPNLGGLSSDHGMIRFSISGDLGPDYTVLGSTNLLDWVPIVNTNPPIMPFLFVEPNNTNYGRRFYRVLLGP
ncbi:LamG-like jellyroll fold domain-containing protein [Pedosphaera parvula]|uniref:PA14 domain protein n=1 Tax=Pedosphaera parvula (strain Ellin514) TaxID=320771 RepID=B9XQP8_PEDPL|nr:LamG-like jellyroll fold domain-containing protein [Pedosphaera parvula]EEF57830.1 PA14 domain protein [Pedosphaera parvula Ellin514]